MKTSTRTLMMVYCLIAVAVLASCAGNKKKTLFAPLPADDSGIGFNNTIRDNDSSLSFINEFGYMGGGVGIGDFNNDGLKDIYFTGNQVSSRLYMNKGGNRFEDITIAAKVNTADWCTGVSIVDINQDGYDDIYVCVFGRDLLHRSKNLLFINQQDLTFKEAAAAYGLADTGYSTQAAFFDYDRDGDLDMYLTNYLLSSKNTNAIYPRDKTGRSPANDRLYRNERDSAGTGHPLFTDVSMEAGIKEDGYGLGLSISDINNDGWPDIYVANDFISNDLLWLNNRNGTFTNCIGKALQHQSYSSMGSDAADLNNDGLTDIITLDMLPELNERKKISFSFMNYERYESERAMGYEPEFMRNMLQLNRGNRMQGDTSLPFFSEIGQLSGIPATDWSWSVLLADFNNDGWKDVHVTNGIGRDFINADFLEFSNNIFNSSQSREQQQRAIRQKLASLDHINLPNYLYINQQDVTFADASETAGIDEPSMSNGAAYADLDNDGDLDLVINNINKEAFVFINTTNQPDKENGQHFLSVVLKGDSINRQGMGAKLVVYSHGLEQSQEQYPVRGYFSSVDSKLIFGLGKNKLVDSLVVKWPGGKKQVLQKLKADTTLTVFYADAFHDTATINASPAALLFAEASASSGLMYHHNDQPFNDYTIQRLLPQKYSQMGPFIATGNIDKDGSTDFFIGGAIGFSGAVFTQQPGQTFKLKNLLDSLKYQEDMDVVLFDADKDGDDDLLVACGDVQYAENSPWYVPRLYINDGKGNFQLAKGAIPTGVNTIAGCVSTGDYDGDGDIDLFVGGRVSKSYPLSPRSYLLQNNGGVFKDVTAAVCPALQHPGMVTAAVWADMDNDRQADLVIAGEWMPVRIFKNNKGRLAEISGANGLNHLNGLWRSLIAVDMDKDGDMDLVAGNLGLNCEYKVTPATPMQLHATDMDGNGSVDPVLFYHIKSLDGGKSSFPGVSRGRLADQVPGIKKQFLLHDDFARANFNNLFSEKAKQKMTTLVCNETRSYYFENAGQGKFVQHLLPIEAQFAPVNAMVCDDLDGDGYNDLVLAGNEYQAEVMTGRYDASFGCFLKGGPNHSFKAVSPTASGFIVDGDVKDMALLPLAGGHQLLLVAVNNSAMKAFRINKPPK